MRARLQLHRTAVDAVGRRNETGLDSKRAIARERTAGSGSV